VLVKQGGTTYTFVTDGIERALGQAKAGRRPAPFRAAGDGRVESERICLAQSGQFTDLPSACANTNPESRRRPQLSPFVDVAAAAAAAY
jgi:hypothetical protein